MPFEDFSTHTNPTRNNIIRVLAMIANVAVGEP
jgi:hypothetical protein